MLGKKIRHIGRYHEVATVFAKHGLGFIVQDLGLLNTLSLPKRLFTHKEALDSKSLGERIRRVIEDLGPTFIKLGQIASTRPDLIPQNIILELEKLQDRVGPFPYEKVQEIIQEEMGLPVHEVFAEFSENPLATASIGQVHRAVLKTGEEVAVKIQRPQITTVIETDLEILFDLAGVAEQRLEWAKLYHISEIVEEFAKSLLSELEYTTEGRNSEKIAKQFLNQPLIHIPKVYWDYSTKRVLTMEYIHGTKLNEHHKLYDMGYNRKEIAKRIIEAIFHQILVEGFFHGDPHPGNIFIMPNEAVSFIDFGMVGRLTPEMKYHFVAIVIAMIRKNTDSILKAVLKMGLAPSDVNKSLLRKDIDNLKEKYLDIPLSQVSLGKAVKELFSVTFKHHIRIPADLTLLGKSLLTLEGVIEKLDPELSIIDVAQPFGTKLLRERYQINTIFKRLFGTFSEYSDLLLDLPKQTKELITNLQQGKLEVQIPQLDVLLQKLDRVSNQISFSIVLLSFSIVLTGLMVVTALGRQATVLWGFPIIELGFGFIFLMLFYLLFSIFRTGRF